MPHAPEPLTPYEQVEQLWSELQGGYCPLSPLDFSYLDAWVTAGISFTAIRTGIRNSFATFRPQLWSPRVRSIRYCQAAIFRAAEELSLEEFWIAEKEAHDARTAL